MPSRPRALVVQHLPAEGPAEVAHALTRAGVAVVVHRCDLAGPPPPLDGFAGLVVMGGTMAAHDDRDFPTRRAEIDLLASALRRAVPTLGICLGAQLLAVAAGARAFPGADGLEIGWLPVTLTAEAARDPLLAGIVGPLTVLQWHADTFDLPDGAEHLASGTRYANQAFRVGPVAWGLQFHVEVDEHTVDAFVAADAAEAEAADGGATGLAAAAPHRLAALGPARDLVLDRFAALVASPEHPTT